MRWLSHLLFYVRSLFGKRRLDARLDEEVRTHVEMATEANIAKGMPPREARFAALREFGNVAGVQELTREERGWRGLDLAWKDIRHAIRGLRRSPGFTLVAVAMIAIGIGAGTAVFSLVNAILLRSLPVPNPQELRVLYWSGTDVRMRSINRDYHRTDGSREVYESVNHPTFLRLRDQAGDRAEVFGFFPLGQVTAQSGRRALAAEGLMVSDNLFRGLQVRAARGRVFQPGDDAAGVPQAVISHALWQREFAGDAAIIGRTIAMHGIEHPIIGVLPADFHGVHPGREPDVYVPMLAESPFLYVPLVQDWHWFIRLMARVAPGVSDAPLASALTVAFTDQASDRMNDPRMLVEPGAGGLAFDREAYGRPLLIMLGITGMVLLVACTNLAGLSLARGAARQHELAVRASLGAGRRRLMGQSLLESALLAGMGGALGVLFAWWGRAGLSQLLAGSAKGLRYDFSLDAKVLGFGLAAVALTAVLAGLLPAWRAGRVDPLNGLHGRGSAGAQTLRWGRWLVVAQIAIAVALLAGAGLGLRSLAQVRSLDPGFDVEQLTVFKLNPASAGYAGASRIGYYDRVLDALEAVPGVEGTGLMQFPLLAEERSAGGFQFTTMPRGDGERDLYTFRQMICDSFFETVGIPVVRGRGIARTDDGDAPKVVVVNETFVRNYLGERDPLGHVMTMWDAEWRIVGVCRDAKFDHVKEIIHPTTYFPFRQRFYDRFVESSVQAAGIAVRSTLPTEALQPAILRAVAAVDPGVPVTNLSSQAEVLNRNIGQERMLATLCAGLAGVALLLCCIGLYGLIAYDVTRRTSEIAIRMAIGAQRRDVARPILRQALRLTLTGLVVGLPAGYAVTHLVRHQLYGAPAHDLVSMGGVAGLLLVVATLAAWLPARRATRVDPLAALRRE